MFINSQCLSTANVYQQPLFFFVPIHRNSYVDKLNISVFRIRIGYIGTDSEQRCGSKYIEFGSGSRILAQFLDPTPGLCYQFWKKNYKFNFLLIFFFNYKNKIFSHLSLSIVNLYPKSYTFCSYFIPMQYLYVRIRIPNTDPDPQH